MANNRQEWIRLDVGCLAVGVTAAPYVTIRLFAYSQYTDPELSAYRPVVVLVDERNHPKS